MKKKVTILTATRAEYGLLKTIIKELDNHKEFEAIVVVTGAHLSSEFGLTYREILEDGIRIDRKIEILLSSDTPVSISKSMGLAMISFAEYFEEIMPDVLIVLGDRYETLAVCCAAMNAGIPIVHLYGGETTEGATDEAIRHCITKMSYLHFTSTEEYRKRVIQLGEHPSRVYTVGSIGVENALNMKLLSKADLEKDIHSVLDMPYAVVTFHPATLEKGMAEKQFSEILKALECYTDIKFIFTKANADAEGRIINKMIEDYASVRGNVIFFDSLGALKYLSLLKYAMVVIGNSSSGLIEAPSFHIPTINIGDRQKGRLSAESVIHCNPIKEEICKALDVCLSSEFREKIKNIQNPYGNGQTSKIVVKILEEKLLHRKINLKKEFYDISF